MGTDIGSAAYMSDAYPMSAMCMARAKYVSTVCGVCDHLLQIDEIMENTGLYYTLVTWSFSASQTVYHNE